MNRKNLLRVSVILLIVFINLAYSSPPKDGDFDGDDYGIRDPNPSRDDRRKKDGYRGVENSGYGKGDRGRYDGGVNGYYDDDDDEYRRKGIIGYGGKDPRRNGIDFGDYGPVFGKNNSMLSRLNVWISSADDWEEKRSGKYGSDKYGSDKYDSDKYGSDKYDSDKYGSDKYDSDRYDSGKKSYKNNQRRKRSYSKVTFPVKQVKNYKKFPFFRFPPLISIAPWLPIFYDKLTYQTFIFSLTGGLYIIPPIINFYGQRFAVAQLIKWGYASLVSSGIPPPPAVNVAPLVQPGPPPPPPPTGPGPKYEKGVMKTDYPSFRPRPDYLQKSINDAPASNKGSGPYPG